MPDLSSPSPRQPWLHDLSICVGGNVTALSADTGDIRAGTAQGLYVDDSRVLSRCEVTVSGELPSRVASVAHGGRAEFFLSARNLGTPGADPTVELRRERELRGAGMVEALRVVSRASETVDGELRVSLACDGAPIASVKAGHLASAPVPAQLEGGALRFATGRHLTTVTFSPPPARLERDGDGAAAVFSVRVAPGEAADVVLTVETARQQPSALDADSGSDAVDWSRVRVESDDPRLRVLVDRSLDDLRHLLLRDPDSPEDVFAAAGTPWYLTLFGRDSIWSARLMLPFGTDLAGGTLRALARRQGMRTDAASAEAPGKIPHELRRTAYVDPESGLTLPPVYYGTVDATALWVTLLGEARLWGLPDPEVRQLLPALRAAVAWLTGAGQPDDDGFLKYLDTTGRGLANQGWKDSGDSMRCRDGSIAEAPIALVEAQAYAVEALVHAAALFEAFGERGAEEARTAALALQERVRASFWVTTDAGRHLALALDGRGRPVDGLGSNMGHALGTGTLSAAEAALVAAVLTGDELLDQFGVRTLGSGNGGFNPLGYHTGSVWTHDTAIAAWGLSRERQDEAAGRVARSLVDSAEAFAYRWPELYSGEPMLGRPAPYPASCRPQAWSAASAAAIVSVALGPRPDAPAGVLELRPPRPAPFGRLRVDGLRFRGAAFSVEVHPEGSGEASVEVAGLPEEFEVRVASA